MRRPRSWTFPTESCKFVGPQDFNFTLKISKIGFFGRNFCFFGRKLSDRKIFDNFPNGSRKSRGQLSHPATKLLNKTRGNPMLCHSVNGKSASQRFSLVLVTRRWRQMPKMNRAAAATFWGDERPCRDWQWQVGWRSQQVCYSSQADNWELPVTGTQPLIGRLLRS